MNALVTDHQMFALKSLQIPTPGKFPSPHLSKDLDISRFVFSLVSYVNSVNCFIFCYVPLVPF